MSYLALVVISIAINVVVALLMPKPKNNSPSSTREFEAPTADAGRPVPVVFGTVTVKSSNVLWYGEKATHEYKVKV